MVLYRSLDFEVQSKKQFPFRDEFQTTDKLSSNSG